MTEKNQIESTDQNEETEFQFRDLFYALPWMIIPGFLALLIAGGLLLSISFILPSFEVYRQSISPTMEQSAPNQYPSGAPFAADDLRSRLVLESVYTKLNLEQFDITLADFFAAVTVKPFSTTANEVVERYHELLNNKKLTFSEREIIEGQLKSELTQRNYDEILVTFTAQSKWAVPESLGQSIVSAIPAEWQTTFIEKLGAAGLYEGYARHAPFSPEDIGSLDTFQGYESVLKATNQLNDLLTSVESTNRFKNVRGEDDRTIEDYALELDRIQTDVLNAKIKPALRSGITSDIPGAIFFIESRIAGLNHHLEENQSIVRSLRSNDELISGRSASSSNSSGVSAQTNGQSNEDAANTLNTIIGLVEKSNFSAFRQETLNKLLEAEALSASINRKIALQNEFLSALKNRQATDPIAVSEEANNLRASMQDTASRVAQIWQKTIELIDISYGSEGAGNVQLYRSNSTLDAYQVQRYFSLLTLLIISLGIAVAASSIGACVYTYRLCKRRGII